jgi:hypothetical protein
MVTNDLKESMENSLRTIQQELGVDFLFEPFCAIVSDHVPKGEIHVIPHDHYSRNYRNDIIPAPYELTHKKDQFVVIVGEQWIQLFTSRSSLLDYLPEIFYVEPDNTKEFFDENQRKRSHQEKEQYREEVKAKIRSAKRFFRPLEVIFNQVRIERELAEISALENFDALFESLWNRYPIKTKHWRRFVRTLHLVRHVVGDLDKTAALIEYVLDTPVTLSLSIEESFEIEESDKKMLMGADNILGYNVIFGNTIFDYLEICTLKLDRISKGRFNNYFSEHSEDRKLLDAIINHYFPLNVEVRLDFSISHEKDIENEERIPVLGYSSTLGNP